MQQKAPKNLRAAILFMCRYSAAGKYRQADALQEITQDFFASSVVSAIIHDFLCVVGYFALTGRYKACPVNSDDGVRLING
jgi:hypothetical protein